MNLNALHNVKNPYQGNYKKVLCVCSAGLLRSPTTAVVLSQEPYNFNTRAAGLQEDYALIPVSKLLLVWADEIVCMTYSQQEHLEELLKENNLTKEVKCLNIDDNYAYRDEELISKIKESYK